MTDIYGLLGFDMETDVGSWSPFYEGLTKGTQRILELLEKNDLAASFFFTGEAAQKHPEIVNQIQKSNPNHDIGCHSLYHETVGDPLFEIPGIKPILPEEVENRLRITTEIVEKVSGKRPVSFRAPRLWGSTNVVLSLENLGYVVDVSYPMYFYADQLIPYHPDRDNWLKKGDLRIVEIPNTADMSVVPNDLYKRDRDLWPIYRTESGESLIKHVDNFLNRVKPDHRKVVLCFYLHPWEFIDMPNSFTYGEGTVIPDEALIKNCGDYALNQLSYVITDLLKKNTIFMTATDIATKLDWNEL